MKTKQILNTKGVKINDVTLRDGEQAYGIVFSNREKVVIAKMLDEVGVHQIEVGFPSEGGYETQAIEKIVSLNLSASLLGWHRPVISEIKRSIDVGMDSVAISISTSDMMIMHKLRKTRQWVLDTIVAAVEFAKGHGLYVSANAEDGTRTDTGFLMEFARAVKKAGADRLRYCDTLGLSSPFKMLEMTKKIVEEAGIDVEMHTHNDLGMAVANALAGAAAGATWIGTSVAGIGERTGNAALEEVVMALKITMGIDLGFKTELFLELCHYVARASGRVIVPWKAIVGDNIFSHSSGIHADGVLKDAHNYELFDSQEVGGIQRRIGVGKHSGAASVKYNYHILGVEINDEETVQLLAIIRKETVELKRMPDARELMTIYEEFRAEQESKKKQVEKIEEADFILKEKAG